MADLASLEQTRKKYEESLVAVAESMKHCSKMAEALANCVKTISFGTEAASALVNGAGEKRKRASKKEKDPNAPKRPASSYIIFQNEIRNELKKSHPSIDNKELLAKISQIWQDLPEEKKAAYHERVEKDKERFKAEMAAYEARTPEQIAADEAAAEAAAEAKKASRKSMSKSKSKDKESTGPAKPSKETKEKKKSKKKEPTPPPARPSSPEESEGDEEEEEEASAAARTSTSEASEESEEDSEEEEAPPPKKHKSKRS